MFYKDSLVDDSDKNSSKYVEYPKGKVLGFMVYPWHRSGSLNNDTNRPQDKGTRTAVLKRKRISNLKFSSYNIWLPEPYTFSDGITPVSVFNSNEVSMVRIPVPENSGISSIIYYGNVDTVITHKDKYMHFVSDSLTDQFTADVVPLSNLLPVGDGDYSLRKTLEPIRMRYKSTPHAVFALNHVSSGSVWNNPVCLPSVNNLNRVDIRTAPFWTEKIQIGDNPLEGYTVLDCHFGGSLGINNKPSDDLPMVARYTDFDNPMADAYCLCKWVEGQGWVVDNDTMRQQAEQKIMYNPVEPKYRSMYFYLLTNMVNGLPYMRKAILYDGDSLGYNVS